MKKKLVALLLVLALAVCIFPASAFALTSDGYPSGSHRNSSGNWIVYVWGTQYYVDYGTVVKQGNTSYSRNVFVAQIGVGKVNIDHPEANCSVGDADGIFGSNTYKGVKNFQSFWNNNWGYSSYYAIDVDGIVGNCTWACISATST